MSVSENVFNEMIQRIADVFELDVNNIRSERFNNETARKIIFSTRGRTFEVIEPEGRTDNKNYFWLCDSEFTNIGFNFLDNVLFSKKTKMVRKFNELNQRVQQAIENQYIENTGNSIINQLHNSDSFSESFGEISTAQFDHDENCGPIVTVNTNDNRGNKHRVIFDVFINSPYARIREHQVIEVYETGTGSPVTNWIELNESNDIEEDSIPEVSENENQEVETESSEHSQ